MTCFSALRAVWVALALVFSSAGSAHAQEPVAGQEAPAEFEQGVRAFQAGQMAEALRLWNSLLERYPLRPELLNNLAVLYSRSGDSQRAGQLLVKAAVQAPHYASVALNLQRFKAPGDTPPDLALILDWPRPGVTVSRLDTALERRPPQRLGRLMESVQRAEQHRLAMTDEAWLGTAPAAAPEVQPGSRPKLAGRRATTDVILDAELEQALATWKDSWIRRDVAAYLNWYAVDFNPASGMSRADWQKLRQARLTAAKQIDLTVQVTRTEAGPLPDSLWIYTVQRYKSAVFQDVSDKSMLWVKTPDGWRILRELSTPPAKRG